MLMRYFTVAVMALFLTRVNSTGRGSPKVRLRDKQELHVGLLVPHTSFGVREYIRAVNSAILSLQKGRGPRLKFLDAFEITPKMVHLEMMTLTPSPTGN